MPADDASQLSVLDPEILEGLRMLVDDDDDDFLPDLFRSFQSTYTRCSEGMTRAAEANDSAEFHRQAHTLKGAAGNLGAMRIMDLAEQMQRMGESQELGDASACLLLLGQEYEALLKEARREIPGLEPASSLA